MRAELVSKNRAIQKIYELARANTWEYFVTLTFKENRYDYDILSEKLHNWIKIVKRSYCPDLKYIFVPELHKDGAFHFHGIISNIGRLPLIDSGHKQKGKTIYNIDCYKLGFTTATKVFDSGRVASYITKYITKELCAVSKGKKRYWASRNFNKADIVEYNVSADEIEQFLLDLSDKITYRKVIEVPMSHTKIQILEIDEKLAKN